MTDHPRPSLPRRSPPPQRPTSTGLPTLPIRPHQPTPPPRPSPPSGCPGPARDPRRPRLRGADADPARGDPAAAGRPRPPRPRPRPGPARPPPSPCRCSSGSTADGPAAAGRRPGLVLVPTRELAMQVAEAFHRYGRGLGVRVCRSTAASRSASSSRGLRRGRRRRRRHAGPGRRPPPARHPTPRRASDRGARRGRRDARHGLRRGPRGDPRRDAGRAPDGALLGHDLPARSPRSRRGTSAIRSASPSRRRATDRRGAGEGAPDGVRRAARADKLAALGRVLDVEDPDVGPRLLPHPARGRRPRRGAQRPRLRRGRAPRRHHRRTSATGS